MGPQHFARLLVVVRPDVMLWRDMDLARYAPDAVTNTRGDGSCANSSRPMLGGPRSSSASTYRSIHTEPTPARRLCARAFWCAGAKTLASPPDRSSSTICSVHEVPDLG